MITGKILKTYGWPEGKIIGLAKAAAEDLAKTGLEQGAILVWLDGVREEPGKYLADPMFATLARECLRRAKAPHDETYDIVRDQPVAFTVWGENLIEPQAVAQMENAHAATRRHGGRADARRACGLRPAHRRRVGGG